MCKEVTRSKRKRQTLVQRSHNAKTNMLPVCFEIGSYIMIRAHAKRNGKLESIWRGPMRVVSSKPDLMFVVKDIVSQKQQIVHAQRMVHYPSTAFGNIASHELKEQAIYYDAHYQLVKDICGVCK